MSARRLDPGGWRLCVGLDPHPELLPAAFPRTPRGVRAFLQWAIDQTAPFADAYKANAAFYEMWGSAGWRVLRKTVARVRGIAPRTLMVLDGKRGDISSTAAAYARAAAALGVDAVTISPYMGMPTAAAFLAAGLSAFVLTLPTNPAAQPLVDHGEPPLYLQVAQLVRRLAGRFPGRLGLVVGATRPEAARRLHHCAPELPWLVPGVGAQAGDLTALLAKVGGHDHAWVNASRSLLFAPDPAAAARALAQRLQTIGGTG
ncbi:MAG: orotidine-5'-phosphate decarboxylase [Candidatus Bipolaricaulaceae bacterium]